jgi:hypothetical protein
VDLEIIKVRVVPAKDMLYEVIEPLEGHNPFHLDFPVPSIQGCGVISIALAQILKTQQIA